MDAEARVLRDAARYLGMAGRADEALPLMREAYGLMMAHAAPRHMVKRFPVEISADALVIDGLPPVRSRDLMRLFAGAKEGLALLATLGAPLDALIRRYMLTNPALGAAIGACGSAYVDVYIDGFLEQEASALQAEGLALSPRFSPGYGDAPLDMQPALLGLLEARRLGVTLTRGMLMLPEKSVTALVAVRGRSAL